ncbi:hypothetical protein L9G15_20540 [Shewanella sp. A3A]|nr:hypothetical protein [Shewanella ferrihydritica]
MMSFFENLSTLDDALTRNAFLGEEKARRRPREAARGEAKVEHSDDDDDGDAISLSLFLSPPTPSRGAARAFDLVKRWRLGGVA